MSAFQSVASVAAQHRSGEHGGHGPILFRRVLDHADFSAPVDFVDYTVIAPGSSIGRHYHVGTEEIYYIAAGSPLMRVDAEEARLHPGSVSVVRDGGCHELINDTPDDVAILVIQVRT